ncbi:MAG: mechanosensitive ion channel family protein [Bryobacteraceae bacterium]
MRNFIAAAAQKNSDTAIHYLNTPLRGEAAAALVRQLSVVLNRRLPAKLNEISDRPEGSLSDPKEPGKELIGSIPSDTGDVDIQVERIDRDKAGSIWLFSRNTLAEIPELYAEVASVPTGNRLAQYLVETRIARVSLIQWLAVLAGLPLLHFLGIRLNRVLSRIVGQLLRRAGKTPGQDFEVLPAPVRLLLLAVIIRSAQSTITLPLLARQFWSGIATISIIVGVVWLVMRLNGVFEEKIRLRLGRRNSTGALSILRFARSAVDASVLFVGLLFLLNRFGVNPAAAITGLGVGGIAVALAAQKTLENVIAGISLISDKAIRVGDFLRIGPTLGTVTDIGLRSTRIRTLDRCIVNVPNGQIANASLENLTLRDQFWFHHILRVTSDTTGTQLRSMLEGITQFLAKRPNVNEPSVHVRFLAFGESSFDVEMFAYFPARDWKDFLRIQEGLLLEIVEMVERAGAKIALPSRMTYVPDSFPRGAISDAAEQATATEEARAATSHVPDAW